jgi:GTP-binding protein YchF
MKLALAGLPGSGKSTIFSTFTSRGRAEKNLALLPIMDDRTDDLIAIFNPKKITYAQIAFVDPNSPIPKPGDSSARLPLELKQADGLVEVLRNFDGGFGTPQPRADHQAFLDELILSDLLTVENRLERIAEGNKRGRKADLEEVDLLETARDMLTREQPLILNPELAGHPKIRSFAFLTAKPALVVANNEDDEPDAPLIGSNGTSVNPLVIRARIEAELVDLPLEEREEFSQDLGLEESSLNRIITASFRSMDMITFFTAGPSEVRSWSLKKGSTASKAAGTIHSDIEKGFIRAEVIRCEDLLELGSEAAVKKAGKMNLVGRDHVIEDGDVLNVRFNI